MIIGDRVVVTGVGLICALGDRPDDVFDRILARRVGGQTLGRPRGRGIPDHHRQPGRRRRRARYRPRSARPGPRGASGDRRDRPMRDCRTRCGRPRRLRRLHDGRIRGLRGRRSRGARRTSTMPRPTRSLPMSPSGSGRPDARRTYGTACAAGNYAIGNAARAILAGRVDRAVAGGVDAFSKIAMLGFARARAMSSERCRPFDRNRRGMQLGEGAGFVVLERESAARRRGARVRGVVGALGLSGDAHHPTAPRPGRQRHLASDGRRPPAAAPVPERRRVAQCPRNRHATVGRRRGRRDQRRLRRPRRAGVVVEGRDRALHGRQRARSRRR